MKYAHLPLYISGPLTAATPELRESNIRVAERAYIDLVGLGFPCICVHSAARTTWGTHDEVTWLVAVVTVMKLCKALWIVGDNPFDSAGTRLEINEAGAANIPIFFASRGPAELLQWAKLQVRV